MNRNGLEYYARKYGLALVIASAFIIFVLPLLLRILQGAPITPGAQSYVFLRQANLLHAGAIGEDTLHGTPLAPHPYILLLAVMQLFGAPWLLPPLLGMLLLVLLFSFFNRIISARAVVVLALVALILSPGISILATHHAPVLLCMVFIVAALLTFTDHPYVAAIMAGLAVVTTPALGILAACIFAAMFFRHGHYRELTSVAAVAAIGIGWYYYWNDTPGLRELLAPSFHPDIFFELGAAQGISIFLVILAAYGSIVFAGKKQDAILSTILLLGASFFIPLLIPILTITLAVFAAYGIYHLMTARWQLELLQSALLVLVSCLGLFLLITAVRERAAEGPDAGFAHTMVTLRNQYHPGAVLTDPAYAPMIEYFTGRRATVSSMTSPDILQKLLHSRTTADVYPLLVETDTSYVLISREMEGSLFRRSDEGILFLVENTEQFVNIEQTQDATLWFFIRPR